MLPVSLSCSGYKIGHIGLEKWFNGLLMKPVGLVWPLQGCLGSGRPEWAVRSAVMATVPKATLLLKVLFAK
jgi:hypothetical protein